jgi:hypothetical protein
MVGIQFNDDRGVRTLAIPVIFPDTVVIAPAMEVIVGCEKPFQKG